MDTDTGETSVSPPPIRVLRQQPNWGLTERIRLLDQILKFMEDPTRASDRAGLTKMDLEMNVLPKVSPHRKLDEITAQYYRYNLRAGLCPCIHFTYS